MTCLSDIDLATLHQHRLEERFSYKLAWSGTGHQQVQYNDLLMRHNASLKRQRIIPNKSSASTAQSANTVQASESLASSPESQQVKSEDEPDDGYFDSSTRRRRSGTWP